MVVGVESTLALKSHAATETKSHDCSAPQPPTPPLSHLPINIPSSRSSPPPHSLRLAPEPLHPLHQPWLQFRRRSLCGSCRSGPTQPQLMSRNYPPLPPRTRTSPPDNSMSPVTSPNYEDDSMKIVSSATSNTMQILGDNVY